MTRVKDGSYSTGNYNISTKNNFLNENVVSVKGLRKSFKSLTVLDGIDFDIKKVLFLPCLDQTELEKPQLLIF